MRQLFLFSPGPNRLARRRRDFDVFYVVISTFSVHFRSILCPFYWYFGLKWPPKVPQKHVKVVDKKWTNHQLPTKKYVQYFGEPPSLVHSITDHKFLVQVDILSGEPLTGWFWMIVMQAFIPPDRWTPKIRSDPTRLATLGGQSPELGG